MQASYQIIRVFNKPGEARGNTAAIINENDQVDLPVDRSKLNAVMHNESGIDTTCFVSMVTAVHYNVQCFNDKSAIQCCGHGMIAAAKTIFAQSGLSEITINNNVTASAVTDNANTIALTLPRLTATQQAVPAWTNNLITLNDKNLLVDRAAISSQEDGYLLLAFDSLLPVEDFRKLKIDLKKICENTQRAVVLVQADKANEKLMMRYFAPQYGIAEDSATGSVMRFVADYIEKQHQLKHFEVSQCSPRGGYMKVDCFTEYIQITANASLESN